MAKNKEKGSFRAPVSEEEYKRQLKETGFDFYGDLEKGILHLYSFEGVKKFRSIRRAIRRGHVSVYGEVLPHRPFKNHSPNNNPINRLQRGYYQQLTHRRSIY